VILPTPFVVMLDAFVALTFVSDILVSLVVGSHAITPAPTT
jgi:hypothetical protein